MPLTRAADYAIRVMIHLAGLPHRTAAAPADSSCPEPTATLRFWSLRLVESPIHLNVCLAQADACDRQWWYPAHHVWQQAQDAMAKVLRTSTIDDLARRAAPPLYS